MANISTFEKLIIILQKLSIDFNEFNVKFEKSERQEAVNIERNESEIDSGGYTWEPFLLHLDPRGYVSSSLIGNGVNEYRVQSGSPAQGFMTGSNPIYGSNGSLMFWASASSFFGDDIYPVFGGMNIGFGAVGGSAPANFVAYSADTVYARASPTVLIGGAWQFYVIKQDNIKLYNFGNGQLDHSGSARNITGSVYFFDNIGYMTNEFPPPDYNTYNITVGFANIAMTNRNVTEEQILAMANAGVTANYKDILGYTPEAYWRGAPVSGTPYYVPNEVF